MSEINSHHPQNEYMLPNDQIAAEFQLLNDYETSPMKMVIERNLEAIKRVAGYAIPQYGKFEAVASNEDGILDDPNDMTNDIGGGYVEFGSTAGPVSRQMISLMPPKVEISLEEFKQLSVSDQMLYEKTRYGEIVIDEKLPDEAVGMTKKLLSLIGAKIVRDDSLGAGGDQNGSRIWKGTYHGAEVYIQETWNAAPFYRESFDENTEPKAFALYVLGAESGRKATIELSQAELDDLSIETGLHPTKLRKDGVHRENVTAYRGIANQIRGLKPGQGNE